MLFSYRLPVFNVLSCFPFGPTCYSHKTQNTPVERQFPEHQAAVVKQAVCERDSTSKGAAQGRSEPWSLKLSVLNQPQTTVSFRSSHPSNAGAPRRTELNRLQDLEHGLEVLSF